MEEEFTNNFNNAQKWNMRNIIFTPVETPELKPKCKSGLKLTVCRMNPNIIYAILILLAIIAYYL